MNYFIKIAAHIVMIWVISLLSCKKPVDDSSGLLSQNRPPVANAGPDQTISFPTDSVELSGSGTDSDGNIIGFKWSKISGPSSFSIINPDTAVTKVKNLVTGLYRLELKVTDDDGRWGRDTMLIAVRDPSQPNQPPYAIAGNDKTITLPTNSIELKGIGGDNDGTIASYQWRKVSGPSSYQIIDPNSPITIVNNLVEGLYEFEFKVIDNGGLFSTDRVFILVVTQGQVINMQLVPVGNLSANRAYVATATAGNKIFFAGGSYGETDPLNLFSRVDIYDISNGTWTKAELSEPRTGIGAIAIGNKVLFAGGAKSFNYEYGWGDFSKRVDIYHISTNTWSSTELPESEVFLWNLGITAAAGNKTFFYSYNIDDGNDLFIPKVHIYDVVSNSWTSERLSENYNKPYLVAASFTNKIMIVGGDYFWKFSPPYLSKRVDIYHAATNTWSIDSLIEGRREMKATTLNNRAFFAGGWTESEMTDKVEIYDNNIQSWSVAHLSRPTVLAGAASDIQRAVFFGSLWADVYDDASNKWYVANSSQQFSDAWAFVGAGGNIYATDGNTVWRIQF